MKNLSSFLMYLLCGAAALSAGAAYAEIIERDGVRYRVEHVDIYEVPKAGWEMLEALNEQPQMARFRQAIEQIGLTQPLNTESGFTAFVPVDAVFAEEGVPEGFLVENNPQAQEFLSRHVVNQKINTNLLRGTYERYRTVAGTEVRLQRFGNRITVNGEPIVGTMKTPYGFIYIINGFVEKPGMIATANND